MAFIFDRQLLLTGFSPSYLLFSYFIILLQLFVFYFKPACQHRFEVVKNALRQEKQRHRITKQQSNRRKKSLRAKANELQHVQFKRKQEIKRTAYEKKLLGAIKNNPVLLESIENSFKEKHARRYRSGCQTATRQKLSSAAGFKHLRETGVLILPHPKSITRWHRNMSNNPGFNRTVLKKIKDMAKAMSAKEKVVAILVDGMAIKPSITYHPNSDVIHGFPDGQTADFENNNPNHLANEAIVIMVRSLYTKFKQVLGYFLCKSSLGFEKQASIIRQAITFLVQAGLKPVLLVMDQHTTNVKMAEYLGVSEEDPFFNVDTHKVA